MRSRIGPLLAAMLVLLPALVLAGIPLAAKAAQFIMYVGSYTAGTSKGIYGWKFSSRDGSISPLGRMR